MSPGADDAGRSLRPATLVFAASLIVFGAVDLAGRSFAPVWEGVPAAFPARGILLDLCALVELGSGFGLIFRRTSRAAAAVLAGTLALWLLIFKLRIVLLTPRAVVSYESLGETAVLLAAAWTLAARAAWDRRGRWANLLGGPRGVRAAAGLFGCALLAFGASHAAYLHETAALVPRWLPGPEFWALGFGATYAAAGLAILGGIRAPLAAKLVVVQMALFTLLVWGPAVIATPRPGVLSECADSWILTLAAWVVAASCASA